MPAMQALHTMHTVPSSAALSCRNWQQGQSQPLREPDAVSIKLAEDLDWVDPRDR
jgi:hypothetical protein